MTDYVAIFVSCLAFGYIFFNVNRIMGKNPYPFTARNFWIVTLSLVMSFTVFYGFGRLVVNMISANMAGA